MNKGAFTAAHKFTDILLILVTTEPKSKKSLHI